MMILVADCGSTKTDWRILSEGRVAASYLSAGFNPAICGESELKDALGGFPADVTGVGRVFFYGAGIVSDEIKDSVEKTLGHIFQNAVCVAGSDLLGAARGLFGNGEGIACIVGTGAGTVLCSGGNIVRAVSSGGYILGDEGSGSWIGKRMLSDYIKGLAPSHVAEAMNAAGDLDYQKIVRRVYREPRPNTYIASFAGVAASLRGDGYVEDIVEEGFALYFRRNVLPLYREGMTVRMAGSVAYGFSDIAVRAAAAEGICVDSIVKSPCDGLVSYHIENEL